MHDLMLALPLVSLAALIILNITSRERFKERHKEHHRAHIQHSTASAANEIPAPEDKDLSMVQELVKRSLIENPLRITLHETLKNRTDLSLLFCTHNL